jgi:hypothetical protein
MLMKTATPDHFLCQLAGLISCNLHAFSDLCSPEQVSIEYFQKSLGVCIIVGILMVEDVAVVGYHSFLLD